MPILFFGWMVSTSSFMSAKRLKEFRVFLSLVREL